MKKGLLYFLFALIIFSQSACTGDHARKKKEEYTEKKKEKAHHVGGNQTSEVMDLTYTKSVKELTDKAFEQIVGKGVVLVDFWATWCKPCLIQGPIIEELAKEVGDRAHICKLDVDKNPQTPNRFNVRNIPTIIIFKDGKVLQQFVGVQSKDALMHVIEKNL
jgi:thioredoxin 1